MRIEVHKGGIVKLRVASIAVVVTLAAGLLAACGSSGGSASSSSSSSPTFHGVPYVIGTVGSYTGPESSSLGQVGQVVQAWADWENAHGGINGHRIKLINKDDKSDPATSLSEVQSMVEQDHVIAIVAENSIVDSAWASYVQQKGVPVIGSAIFNIAYETNPDFFSPGTTTIEAIYGELAAAKKLGKTKLGLMYCAEAAACAQAVPLYTSLAPKAGVDLVYTAKVSAYAPNFTAQCLAAKDAGATVLTAGTDAATAVKIADDCAAQGYHPAWVSQDGSVTTAFLSSSALNGALTVQPVFPYVDQSTPATKAFHQAMAQYAPSTYHSSSFSENAAEDWAGGMLFVTAAKAGNLGNDPTSAKVLDGLYSLHNETLGGISPPLTYTRGQPTKISCWFYMGIKNGKFTTPYDLKTFCP